MSTRPFRHRLAALAVAPLALGLVACGSDDTDADDQPNEVVTETVTQSPDGSSSPDAGSEQSQGSGGTGGSGGNGASVGDIEAAAETAVEAADGATLVSIDIDDTGDWDVTLLSQDAQESEVDVSADGSTVTRGPVADGDDNDADDQAERQRLLQAQVSYVDAIGTARGEYPDLEVTGASLDDDNGTLTWDVDFGDGTNDDAQTVLVDAQTGDVVGTETDDSDDD
ncbi:PepSY domain-containing protein [Nocardioides sp. CFH 31398]|uniref:PepSY domain-containing protein n=1 Tax=Nocardioides sp. CFH 31398 TaxID=2919579 RepID=UPI001F06AF00|nr:PepSY domain-containing protein [Nocardioides sp. CFH 31398]MCH1868034.1 PepSY domain-containing protein [Nocardioides sp. CFH 31398]